MKKRVLSTCVCSQQDPNQALWNTFSFQYFGMTIFFPHSIAVSSTQVKLTFGYVYNEFRAISTAGGVMRINLAGVRLFLVCVCIFVSALYRRYDSIVISF